MKKIIDLVKYNKLVEHYHQESDRSAAIVLSSFIDVCLEEYIMFFMVEDIKSEKLFKNGPLGTFFARIEIAYAFGLINTRIKQDLTHIKNIRNHFAHHPDIASFDNNPVCDVCKELSFAKNEADGF